MPHIAIPLRSVPMAPAGGARPANVNINTWEARSANGGASWTSRRISTRAWNPNLGFFSSGAFIGDYNGIAVSSTNVHLVWTDGRNTAIARTGIYQDLLGGFGRGVLTRPLDELAASRSDREVFRSGYADLPGLPCAFNKAGSEGATMLTQ